MAFSTLTFTYSTYSFADIPYEKLKDIIEERIKSKKNKQLLSSGNEQIYSRIILSQFYGENGYSPVWIVSGNFNVVIDDLVSEIRNSRNEGLDPEDYHLFEIEYLLESLINGKKVDKNVNIEKLADLELLLSDAFLILGAHYVEGKVDPETINSSWYANRKQADLKAILQEAIKMRTISKSLRGLLPQYPEYYYLRDSLARYYKISERGGWEQIPHGEILRNGVEEERVSLLRQRLFKAGDLNDEENLDNTFFDTDLEQAVMRFQMRHGLEADGIVGPLTLQELNTSVESRIKQVLINMERWRWLPQNLGNRYILVNIANFEVEVFDNNKNILHMRAVVGRPYRKTPVFSSRMTYLVFSPYWNVPPSLVANDIIPEVKKDRSYLKKKEMKIFSGWGDSPKEINPSAINWSSVTARNFPYRMRQEPGPNNALGQVKFMFPNRLNIYIHDTPDRELFSKNKRNFSSGCIRINKPLELADYLLSDRTEWSRESILNAMNRKVERTVSLKTPIPVHILYWTAWASEDSIIHFRDDIYERDPGLYSALSSPAPQFASTQN